MLLSVAAGQLLARRVSRCGPKTAEEDWVPARTLDSCHHGKGYRLTQIRGGLEYDIVPLI